MPLHRDIFWLGRQWAVTGFGIQAVNQKLNMQFDVPHLSRLGRGANGIDAGRRLVRHCRFRGSIERRKKTFAGNPANISVSHRQGRLTGLATPGPVGSVF
jgi:hypothetical protein